MQKCREENQCKKSGFQKNQTREKSRVATTPKVITKSKLGFSIFIEKGSGDNASISDERFEEAGATIVETTADMVHSRHHFEGSGKTMGQASEWTNVTWLRTGKLSSAWFRYGENTELVEELQAKCDPVRLGMHSKITRAQKMVCSLRKQTSLDTEQSEAAQHYGGFFSGQMTANEVPRQSPDHWCRGCWACNYWCSPRWVQSFVDLTSGGCSEQVQSMGAEFLQVEIDESGDGGGGYAKTMSKEFIDAEMALFREQAKEVDIVITTALIPNRPAPKLWLEDMLEIMKDGSVVVDLAAERGGNCEGCVPDDVTVKSGVTIVGYTNLACRMPVVSSEFFAMNLYHLLDELVLKVGL